MKRISNLFYLLFIGLVFLSCRDNHTDPIYEGESLTHFNKGVLTTETIISGSSYKDVQISYGVIKAASGTNQVKLLVDQVSSTAVEGTDFQILNNPDELTNGELGGVFTVRLLESGASTVPKTIVFKLQSSTIKNAVYDQTFTINYSLTCPVSTFVGDFTNSQAWWWSPGGVFTIEESTTTANQLLVKDFWDAGIDMVLNYNPDTYVVTIPNQDTGYPYNASANIWAKPSTDASQISSFNPCARTMTLYVNYYVPGVGQYGNKIEGFTGL